MHLLFSKPAFDAFQNWRKKMTEAEELQAILIEPGKAVGKYFDTDTGVAYVFADERDLPFAVDHMGFPLHAADNYGSDGWSYSFYAASADVLIRVRKADPDRNLNLKVGMKVRLVNGDVVTVNDDHEGGQVGCGDDDVIPSTHNRHTGWYGIIEDPYHPLHICEVIEEAENAGGLLDSVKEQMRHVEQDVEDLQENMKIIAGRLAELEGLV